MKFLQAFLMLFLTGCVSTPEATHLATMDDCQKNRQDQEKLNAAADALLIELSTAKSVMDADSTESNKLKYYDLVLASVAAEAMASTPHECINKD